MGNYAQGLFTPKNPEKYMGNVNKIMCRSGWEYSVCMLFDRNPAVISWGSEILTIPYQNPFTASWTVYIPDFLVVYADKKGVKHCEILEVKPAKETPTYKGKISTRTRLTQAINQAKWAAAMKFAIKRGWFFRVLTEREIFGYGKK